jgi:hypothetical protein
VYFKNRAPAEADALREVIERFLKTDPNATTIIAASNPRVAPAVFVAFPLPIVVVDLDVDIRGIGELLFDLPAIAVIIANHGG